MTSKKCACGTLIANHIHQCQKCDIESQKQPEDDVDVVLEETPNLIGTTNAERSEILEKMDGGVLDQILEAEKSNPADISADPIQDRPLPDIEMTSTNPPEFSSTAVGDMIPVQAKLNKIENEILDRVEKAQDVPAEEQIVGAILEQHDLQIAKNRSQSQQSLAETVVPKSSISDEMSAIATIVEALESLDPEAQKRALDYACNSLSIIHMASPLKVEPQVPQHPNVNPNRTRIIQDPDTPADTKLRRTKATIEHLDAHFSKDP